MTRLWTALLDWAAHHSHQSHALVALIMAVPGLAIWASGGSFWFLAGFACVGPVYYAGHEVADERRKISSDYSRNWQAALPRVLRKPDFTWPAGASAVWVLIWGLCALPAHPGTTAVQSPPIHHDQPLKESPMSLPYHHGVRVIEINEGPRPIRTVDTSVIGMVSIADDADATVFPLDTPVLVTDIYTAIGKAGDTGTLAPALGAIRQETNPLMVIVRVDSGIDAAARDTNVIGSVTGGTKTGLKALLNGESLLGVRPRILGAPGLDTLPVASELAVIADDLNGFAYTVSQAATRDEAVTYRSNFSARELMTIWPNDADGMAAATALGLRARLDNEVGWHKTLSNVGINGTAGLSVPVSFSLTRPGSDVGVLNQNDVTSLVNKDGWRFWGSRTCSDDPLFAFESTVRTAQVLVDTIAEGQAWAAGKPLVPTMAEDIVEGINGKLRRMVDTERLIGAECWLDPSLNAVAQLHGGRMLLDYDFTAVPPLEDLTLQQRITGRYLIDFAARAVG